MTIELTESVSETAPIVPPSSTVTENIYNSTVNIDVETHPSTTNKSSDGIPCHRSGRNSVTNIDSREKGAQKSFFDFSRDTKIILVLCVSTNFLATTSAAIMGPFFPQEAAKKGMSLTLSGFVFSMYFLVSVLTSPIYGAYLTHLGVKFVYVSGLFIVGSCTILFGTLSMGPGGGVFATMCIIIRFVAAVGYSGLKISLYTIASHQSGNYFMTALAVIQTFNGLAFMIAPPIGGMLYTIGGYGLPFYIFGSLISFNGVVAYAFLPTPKATEKTRKPSNFTLLRSTLIVISLMSLIVTTAGVLAYDATFSVHLKEFHLSIPIISVIYILMPGIYAVVGPLWGYLADTKGYEKSLVVFGLYLYTLGWLLAGPSNMLHFLPSQLWVVLVGVSFIGLVYGAVVIPAMKCCVQGAMELGFERNLDTHALVSGLFNFGLALGGMLGPTVIGAIIQDWGFPVACTTIAMASAFMALVTSIYFVLRYVKN